MKFLNLVFLAAILGGWSSLRSEEEGGYDHETLTTASGRVYREVFVLGADADGLTFRHREGIAKIPFELLTDAFRQLYETFEPLADAAPEDAVPPAATVEDEWIARLDEGPVNLTARNRLVIRLPASFRWLGGGIDHGQRVPAWPTWWPDHQQVHRLTFPLFRELAVRDFLYSSDLIPVPSCW